MEASFRMEKGKVPFGSLVKQELELQYVTQPDDNDGSIHKDLPVMIWNISTDPSIMQNDVEVLRRAQSIRTLRLNAAYIPTIRVFSHLVLENHGIYEPNSQIVQECKGQVLESYIWPCQDSPNHNILSQQLCDGVRDCPLGSDEDEARCKGSSNKYVTLAGIALLAYVLIGIIMYFSVTSKCSGDSSEGQEKVEETGTDLEEVFTILMKEKFVH